jgi:hypothetical protein
MLMLLTKLVKFPFGGRCSALFCKSNEIVAELPLSVSFA